MLVVAAVAAATQPATDPMETCSQIGDAGSRLGCFDQEMRRRHGMGTQPPVSNAELPRTAPAVTRPADAQPAQPVTGAAPVAAPHDIDGNFGLEGQQLRQKLRAQQGPVEALPPQILTAQIVTSREAPDHRFTFVLDNGQTWLQTETRAGFYLDAHQSVKISAGKLGSFFLETAKHEFVRVRRLN